MRVVGSGIHFRERRQRVGGSRDAEADGGRGDPRRTGGGSDPARQRAFQGAMGLAGWLRGGGGDRGGGGRPRGGGGDRPGGGGCAPGRRLLGPRARPPRPQRQRRLHRPRPERRALRRYRRLRGRRRGSGLGGASLRPPEDNRRRAEPSLTGSGRSPLSVYGGEQGVERLGERRVGEDAVPQGGVGNFAHHGYLDHGGYLASLDPEYRAA